MKLLVTGAAGFIGYHIVKRLFHEGQEVVGIDNMNDYYDVNLKYDRLRETGIVDAGQSPPAGGKPEGVVSVDLRKEEGDFEYGSIVQSSVYENYRFMKLDLNDREGMERLFKAEQFDGIIHLAAQAGVRYSLENPYTYVDSNVSGFLNVLEGCRHTKVDHLIYASSSSVYGANTEMPFKTTDYVDHPVSLYAATKKSDELMAHTYSHLYGLPTTGLRFFTVYGPWGRPDMALFLFTKAMLEGKPIDVYNYGNMERDFTYIDDIVEGVIRLISKPPQSESEEKPAKPDPNRGKEDIQRSSAPYQLFNIGHGSPVKLMDFISEIEKNLGMEAEKNMMSMQPGDVPSTWADVEDLFKVTGYRPQVPVSEGIRKFIEWYKTYYT